MAKYFSKKSIAKRRKAIKDYFSKESIAKRRKSVKDYFSKESISKRRFAAVDYTLGASVLHSYLEKIIRHEEVWTINNLKEIGEDKKYFFPKLGDCDSSELSRYLDIVGGISSALADNDRDITLEKLANLCQKFEFGETGELKDLSESLRKDWKDLIDDKIKPVVGTKASYKELLTAANKHKKKNHYISLDGKKSKVANSNMHKTYVSESVSSDRTISKSNKRELEELFISTRESCYLTHNGKSGFSGLTALAGIYTSAGRRMVLAMYLEKWIARAKTKADNRAKKIAQKTGGVAAEVDELNICLTDPLLSLPFERFAEIEWSMENFMAIKVIRKWLKRKKITKSEVQEFYDIHLSGGDSCKYEINVSKKDEVEPVEEFLKKVEKSEKENFEDLEEVINKIDKAIMINLSDTIGRFRYAEGIYKSLAGNDADMRTLKGLITSHIAFSDFAKPNWRL